MPGKGGNAAFPFTFSNVTEKEICINLKWKLHIFNKEHLGNTKHLTLTGSSSAHHGKTGLPGDLKSISDNDRTCVQQKTYLTNYQISFDTDHICNHRQSFLMPVSRILELYLSPENTKSCGDEKTNGLSF